MPAAVRLLALLCAFLLWSSSLPATADPETPLGELTQRLAATLRTTREMVREAMVAEARGRTLDGRRVAGYVKQIARDLDALRSMTVRVEGIAGVPLDPSWIEARLARVGNAPTAEQVRREGAELEHCLRQWQVDVAAVERFQPAERNERMARLRRGAASLDAILAQPEFRRDQPAAPTADGLGDRVAAWLEQLFQTDLPGWASWGSELMLFLVVAAGTWGALRFLRQRRPRAGKAGGPPAGVRSPLADADAAPVAGETAAPVGSASEDKPDAATGPPPEPPGSDSPLTHADARNEIVARCRSFLARALPSHAPAPARPEFLTFREWADACARVAPLPPDVGIALELHERAFYGAVAGESERARARQLTATAPTGSSAPDPGGPA